MGRWDDSTQGVLLSFFFPFFFWGGALDIFGLCNLAYGNPASLSTLSVGLVVWKAGPGRSESEHVTPELNHEPLVSFYVSTPGAMKSTDEQ